MCGLEVGDTDAARASKNQRIPARFSKFARGNTVRRCLVQNRFGMRAIAGDDITRLILAK